MSRVTLVFFLFGSLALPAAAQGEGSGERPRSAAAADAAGLNEQGLSLYAAQDYRHALEKFLEAHALDGDPNALFNIGRCYEQLGEIDAALEKYRLFVSMPAADPGGVERARASIDAIESARRRALDLDAQVAAPPPAPPVAPPPAASPGDVLPWVALGGGAAFLAAGTALYVLGAHDHAQVTELRAYGHPDEPAAMTWQRAHALVQSGDTKKLWGSIGLGVGAALVASGGALLLSRDLLSHERSERSEPAAPPLAVAPSLLPRGGALLLAGAFQ